MKKTVCVIFYVDTDSVWGIFSTKKKAGKALVRTRLPADLFYMRVYTIDYRLTADVRYARNTANEVLAFTGGVSDLDIGDTIRRQSLVRGDDVLPN